MKDKYCFDLITYMEYHIVQNEYHNHFLDTDQHTDRHVQIKMLMMKVTEVDIHFECKGHCLDCDWYSPSIVRFDKMEQVVVVVDFLV